MTLAKNNINIADFRLGRNNNKEAMAVISIDSTISKDTISKLKSLNAALSVKYAEI